VVCVWERVDQGKNVQEKTERLAVGELVGRYDVE
jgi:hypothetical protein